MINDHNQRFLTGKRPFSMGMNKYGDLVSIYVIQFLMRIFLSILNIICYKIIVLMLHDASLKPTLSCI